MKKTKLKKIARAKQLLRQGLSKAAAMRVIVKEFNLTHVSASFYFFSTLS